MDDDFPFVEVPPEALVALGKKDPGSRLYRAEGPEEAAGAWFEAVHAIAGDCVSPGGAGMFAPVSRAAVHKRIKEGKLTAFSFHITSTRVGLFGKTRLVRSTAYSYVPVSELKAWAVELEERIVRLGRITREDLEGKKPDWVGQFWDWESKWRKERFNEAGRKIVDDDA